ncbi:bifunctional protein GlmU-like [Rhinophrynus dorsalis]
MSKRRWTDAADVEKSTSSSSCGGLLSPADSAATSTNSQLTWVIKTMLDADMCSSSTEQLHVPELAAVSETAMNPVQYLAVLLLALGANAYIQGGPSPLSVYVLRLGPGEEILTSLVKFVQEKNLKAPFVITCVGSVTKATLRLANSDALNTNEIIYLNERLEIVSLVGTLNEHAHLHISLGDKDGKTVSGHAMGDLEVFTTAEIVIGELVSLEFTREMDERTGFPELVIRPSSENVTSA